MTVQPTTPTKKILRVFQHPSDVVQTDDLSAEEKIKLLHDWEADLRQILVAAEEGMTRDHPDDPGVQLSNVRIALEQLGAAEPSIGAPTRAGGTQDL